MQQQQEQQPMALDNHLQQQQQRQQAQALVEHCKAILNSNKLPLTRAVMINWTNVLYAMPSCSESALFWNQTFQQGNGAGAVGALLTHVETSDDAELWVEFLKALNPTLPAHRRKFCSDEEWTRLTSTQLR